MAIDTALKRKAAAAVALVFFAPGVTPDATKPQAWRQSAAWGYPGIAAGAVDTDLGLVLAAIRTRPSIHGQIATATALHGTPTASPALSGRPEINEGSA